MVTIADNPHPATGGRVGPLLRDWRRRRRITQMELALEAGVSTSHLSFVETGRSRPSPEMVVRLAEQLEVPLRSATSCCSPPACPQVLGSGVR